MKILTAEQIREADKFTVENEPISSVELMERAASRCTEWIQRNILDTHPPVPIHVICGIGNNGGDGLVIARQLAERNFKVHAHILEFSEKHSEDFDINFDRLKKTKAEVSVHEKDSGIPNLGHVELLVDAIFGTGLGRPIEGWIADWVEAMNAADMIISIDAPSGLFSGDNRDNGGTIVEAQHTLTFQVPKLAFFHPSNAKYVGDWHVLDIGLHPKIMHDLETKYWYVTSDIARGTIDPRAKFSHKGSYGHAMLIGGSKGMMGAEVLAAKACLRTGVGLLTCYVPGCGVDIMQTSLPEAMCMVSEEQDHLSGVPDLSKFSAVGIGPGIGRDRDTENMIKGIIHDASMPKVFDADALNILADNKTWLSFLRGPTVLTPHPGEFRRLVGEWESDEEKMAMQQEFAEKHNCVVVLKGAHTSTAFPDGQLFFNSTGNPGMATGGSGDTLTGIITGLLAQDYSPGRAAVLGVYLHGKAGDLSLNNSQTQQSLLPSDVIDHVGRAWETLGAR